MLDGKFSAVSLECGDVGDESAGDVDDLEMETGRKEKWSFVEVGAPNISTCRCLERSTD